MTETGQLQYIEEPAPARWLFGSTSAAPLWLVARLWLGYEWLYSGYQKIWGEGSDAWMDGGAALRGFANGAIEASKQPDHPQVAFGWWVDFLGVVRDNASWLAKVVAVSETLIGIALILGLFTGIAAFFGVVLNFNFIFSGSAGVNPAFLIVGLLLVMAWRNAGWLGLDRWLLPALGTPWQRGSATGGSDGAGRLARSGSKVR